MIGAGLLLAQMVMVGVAWFHPMRYFCWAPYDTQYEYTIEATVDGRDLTAQQVHERYRMRTPGRNPRALSQVTDALAAISGPDMYRNPVVFEQPSHLTTLVVRAAG